MAMFKEGSIVQCRVEFQLGSAVVRVGDMFIVSKVSGKKYEVMHDDAVIGRALVLMRVLESKCKLWPYLTIGA